MNEPQTGDQPTDDGRPAAPTAEHPWLIVPPGGGPWVEVKLSQWGHATWVRGHRDDRGRVAITGVLFRGDVDGHVVDSNTLKEFPIGRIDVVMNAHADVMEEAGANFSREGDDPISATIGGLKIHHPGQVTYGKERPAMHAKLSRPDGTDPDTFYRQVAAAYLSTVQTTSAVAPALAAEAGVPVGTARRWILESRRRGFLPPARKGRAG